MNLNDVFQNRASCTQEGDKIKIFFYPLPHVSPSIYHKSLKQPEQKISNPFASGYANVTAKCKALMHFKSGEIVECFMCKTAEIRM